MRNIRLTLFLLFLSAASYAPLHAQTADFIQTLLQTQTVTHAQAARFVLEAAEVTGSYDKTSEQDAMRYAVEQKWLPKKAAEQDAVSLERLSLLIMKAFELKGGPMYTLFNSAHYSYREMVYKDLIQGRTDPSMTVSGYTMLLIVNRLLFRIEDNPWEMPALSGAPQTEMSKAEEMKNEENVALMEEITAQIESMDIADTDVRITNEGVTISVSNIQFSANSTGLPEKEKQTVAEIARILKSVPGRKILVAGHTALAGNQRDRLRISRERAQAVADYLVLLGARKANEIVVRGYGSDRPIADNKTQEGMALNRRVEITLLENE
jgi:outer membrane protein OmpA-like peptidoglycan-associated protein